MFVYFLAAYVIIDLSRWNIKENLALKTTIYHQKEWKDLIKYDSRD